MCLRRGNSFFRYSWKWFDFDNIISEKIPDNIIKVNKILHVMRSCWKQNVNYIKRYYKKCQILISLKNVNNSVKKLTILKVFGLTSKICHHSILLTNQNILRFFLCILSWGNFLWNWRFASNLSASGAEFY